MSIVAEPEGNGSSSLANEAVPGQPEALLWAYMDEEANDRAMRGVTAAAHQAAITVWLFALDLFATAFGPDSEYGHHRRSRLPTTSIFRSAARCWPALPAPRNRRST